MFKFKNSKSKGAVLVGLMALTGSASAAIPAEATTAITGVQTDGLAMISAGWPVVAAITGGLILIKLFKKVISKVS
ncbi:MAG: major coat protein [Colwellia sp.]